MRKCRECGGEVRDEFRFCPHCGRPQRTKIVEHFRGVPETGDGWLRASMYLGEPRQTRLSVWHGDEAQAAMSLDPDETRRLGRFLLATSGRSTSPLGRIARVLQRL